MFTFKSPITPKNVWSLCFRDTDEMTKIYYEKRTPEEGVQVHGVTDFTTSTVYIDKHLDGFVLAKVLRHELTHIYLWETGQQGRIFDEEEMADIMSVASPIVCKATDEIILRLKEGWYKKGE